MAEIRSLKCRNVTFKGSLNSWEISGRSNDFIASYSVTGNTESPLRLFFSLVQQEKMTFITKGWFSNTSCRFGGGCWWEAGEYTWKPVPASIKVESWPTIHSLSTNPARWQRCTFRNHWSQPNVSNLMATVLCMLSYDQTLDLTKKRYDKPLFSFSACWPVP